MPRLISIFASLILLAVTQTTAQELPTGEFSVVNTTGFVEQNGSRQPLLPDRKSGLVTMVLDPDHNLNVSINGTQFRLFPLEGGLAGLSWNASDTELLHGIDIEALNAPEKLEAIPAWGADIVWPQLGLARFVLLPLGPAAYTGFLVSYPEGKTVVRQMEFRRNSGPLDRPDPSIALD
ncbi:hypothetical protein [Roseibium sp. MMSF_3544]|uniref:hypothetical protein n=1 Tax=unclassified Roseibium TaxID=2629323 RepID=UPI00273DA1E8|nr:hypothetical protein [Roseibium sp. MMSF_3544]